MRLETLRRQRGVSLAVLIAASALMWGAMRGGPGYTRFELPTFDSYVYVTMAENPAVFTVAPWGYRILTPWIVHAMPPRRILTGFEDIARLSLVASGAFLFLFLRRLGHAELPSLLAVTAFVASPPVLEAFRIPLLAEPLSLALETALLLAVQARAAGPLLALLLTLGVLSKELFLLFPPLVYLSERHFIGHRRALLAAALVTLPAALVIAVLHWWWTPYLRVPHARWDLGLLRAGFEVLGETWGDTWPALLVGGIAPVALVGALCRSARPYLARHGYLVLATLALPMLAWIAVPSARPVPLFGKNVLRLLVYAVPLLLPLALLALDEVLRAVRPPGPVRTPPHLRAGLPLAGPAAATEPGTPPTSSNAPWPRVSDGLAWLALAGAVAFPFLTLDRYRRVPLQEPRDGPRVMAVCGESLRFARRVARGETVSFALADQRFVWGVSDPAELRRMRWLLCDGWGQQAHYGTGATVMHEPEATLLLPCLDPVDLAVELELRSERLLSLALRINGRDLRSVAVGPGATAVTVRVPASALFRGDNLLALVNPDGAPGSVRLDGLSVHKIS